MHWLRNPLISFGLALVILGAGNWYTGRTKLRHYLGVLAEQHGSEPAVDHNEFTHLTAAMNTSLLRPLRYGSGEYVHTQDKIEFYRVVDHGGRMLALLGVTCVVIATLLQRRRLSRAF